jgi:hypothetical protein
MAVRGSADTAGGIALGALMIVGLVLALRHRDNAHRGGR